MSVRDEHIIFVCAAFAVLTLIMVALLNNYVIRGEALADLEEEFDEMDSDTTVLSLPPADPDWCRPSEPPRSPSRASGLRAPAAAPRPHIAVDRGPAAGQAPAILTPLEAAEMTAHAWLIRAEQRALEAESAEWWAEMDALIDGAYEWLASA